MQPPQSKLYFDAERIYTSMTDEDILQSGMNIYFDGGTNITNKHNKQRRDVIHHVSNDSHVLNDSSRLK